MEHLFISPTATLLPAWQEAFGQARGMAFEQLPGAAAGAALVWLRLDRTLDLATQVAAVVACCAPAPVIVMSDVPGDDEALAALGARARGYCNSHAGAEVLVKVASVVTQGGLWIGETLMHRLLSVQHRIQVPAAATLPDWRARLTPREIDVALLAAAGARYKEIARELLITERTVKAHMGAILEKLELRDRLQLGLLIGERQHA